MGSGLPLWAQWAWMCISALALGGGVLWTVFYVRGYMIRMEQKTDALLEETHKAKLDFAKGSDELRDALKQLADGMHSLGTAQKMAMGVNVASSLLPMLIQELAGGKNAKRAK